MRLERDSSLRIGTDSVLDRLADDTHLGDLSRGLLYKLKMCPSTTKTIGGFHLTGASTQTEAMVHTSKPSLLFSDVHDILRESSATISTSVLLLKDALMRVVVVLLSATCVRTAIYLLPRGVQTSEER